jgi:transcriptional regulator with GAF, ATPase, and Fis domain
MNVRLIGVTGPLQGTLFALPEGEVSIGRDVTNQLFAADGSLSRRHCLLRRTGAECFVRDLQSRNGTRVNGIPVDERQLFHGDQLSVGSSVLMFLSETEGANAQTGQAMFVETAILGEASLGLGLGQEANQWLDNILATLPGTSELTHFLQSLLKISTAIGGIRDRESLQWQLLGFLFDLFPASRAAVFYFDKTGEVESSAAWDRERGPEQAVQVNQAVLLRVYQEKTGFLHREPDPQSGGREPQTRSILCVPMTTSRTVLGAIYLDRSGPQGPFNDTHLRVLSAVSSIVALSLENLQHWERLRQENQTLRAEVNIDCSMVGVSARMKEVFDFVRRAAPTDATVLIEGESGTGKELVARAIHRNSRRAENVFVAINCAAIAENLLESELFGHERGAFTGAFAQKKGKIEMAEGGTLFLDEVGELRPELQAKLLRVLQEKEFERLGGTKAIPLDTRLIAATNKKLAQAVEHGEFRKDLYYRLNVVTLVMPALRDRPEDIPLLAEHFLVKVSRKCKTRISGFSEEARVCLQRYDWPGNVRELENAVERAVVLGSGELILPEDLPESVGDSSSATPYELAGYLGSVKEAKRQTILHALQQAHGNYIEAAKTLGIHPNSLLRLMRNLNVKAATASGTAPLRDAKK